MIKIEDSLKRVSWVDSVGNADDDYDDDDYDYDDNDDEGDDDYDDDDAVKYLSFIYLFIYLW